MSRVALLLSYDGSNFCGWQIQKNERSVQEDLEKALTDLFSKEIKIVGSGRTDSGVHATGQVAHFDIEDSSLPFHKIAEVVNNKLPQDIRVEKSVKCDNEFHSRFDAKRREYRYYLYSGRSIFAHRQKYTTIVRQNLNLKQLNSFSSQLVGIHDFTTFTAVGDQSNSKVRELYDASFYREGDLTVFRIAGNAFLWKMVRSIVGTILQFSREDRSVDEFKDILYNKNRDFAGTTAPAKGLFLHKVDYGSRLDFY